MVTDRFFAKSAGRGSRGLWLAVHSALGYNRGITMSVYAIALLNIEGRESYTKYEQGFMEVFSKYEGELLAVDEEPTVVEGEWPYTRTVLLRFPSLEEFNRWAGSEEYQAIAQHRYQAAKANITVIKALSADALISDRLMCE